MIDLVKVARGGIRHVRVYTTTDTKSANTKQVVTRGTREDYKSAAIVD